MAEKKIDPAKQYKVTLKDRADFLGEVLLPGREYEMSGESVAALGAKVATAEVIQ